MTAAWAAPAVLLSFTLAMVAAGLAVSLATRPRSLRGRLGPYMENAPSPSPSPAPASRARWRDALRRRQQLRRWRTLAAFHQRLATDLQAAELPLRPTEYVALRLGAGVVTGLVLYLRFGLPLAALPGLVVGAFLLQLWLRRRQAKRRHRFEAQLPDMLDLIATAVRSGQTFARGLQLVADELPGPIATEAAMTVAEMQVGVPLTVAMQHMADRNQLHDLELVVAAVQIQHAVGGDLGEVLGNIGATVRERGRIRGEVRALTAQARMSGWAIGLLPIGLGAGLALLNPTYMQPLITKTVGRALLLGAVVAWLAGFWFVRRIAAVEF